jgi:hypothetical protein
MFLPVLHWLNINPIFITLIGIVGGLATALVKAFTTQATCCLISTIFWIVYFPDQQVGIKVH